MQGTEPAVTIALLQEMLAEVGAGWNIGTFGALAEFHHVAQDPAPMITLTRTGGDAVTARGAIHVALAADVLPVAYEGLANDPQAWTHALSFCLREESAGMGRHSVLTELGADHDALREIDRDAILFDIGVGAPHIDFCLRTDDAALIAVLRQAAGQSILGPGHPAMAAIVATSPHRVCISRLGRVEVYQPIPSGPGARSPIGPHTHLLPQLLRHWRSHSANAPIPDGWVPALNLHPPSPIADSVGRPRPFDAGAHTAFQVLLRAYAPPSVMAEKDRIVRAVLAGEKPQDYLVALSRAEQRAARVALRQMLHTHQGTPALPDWLATFDRGAEMPDVDAPDTEA
jgi:Family of unknown function (DUF6925)